MRAPAGVLAMTVIHTACGDAGCPDLPAPSAAAAQAVLLEPGSDAFKAIPPDTFHVLLSTTAGDIVIEVPREWAPMGAYRFYNLVRNGFYDGAAFYRVIGGFMAQFGAHPIPAVQDAWGEQTMPDDPVRGSNVRGTVTFAKADRDTRTTQLFINYGDNSRLDSLRFAPLGRVVSGMEVVDRLHAGYGETAPGGRGPRYECMLRSGSAYLEREYPELDVIRSARIVPNDE
jgi:peptidyl-prolyl cis-trans isomerase A (cyclophilin A)